MFEINLMKYRAVSEKRRRFSRFMLEVYAALWLLSAGFIVTGFWSNRKALAVYAKHVVNMEQELHIRANAVSPDLLRTMGSRLASLVAAGTRIGKGTVHWGPKF